ncbi:MAG: type II toxin-antitoxin system Phd/YefM family antitoxin [Sporichthyaceae bacterium]
METLPFSDARAALSQLVDRVQSTHARITITRHGRPAVVLIAAEELAALEETLDILGDPIAVQRLRDGETAADAGDVLDADELHRFLGRADS